MALTTSDRTRWVKATKSGSNGNCVEMRGDATAAVVEVRDTKAHGTGPSLQLSSSGFSAWIADAKSGRLDHLG